jgi:glycosyltransferase involved in cell wall biosynthesis
MKILVSHPTGNANVRAVIDGFERFGLLEEFNTTVATNPSAHWLKLLPRNLRNEFLRRKFDVDQNLIRSYPLKELGRLTFPKMGLKQLTQHEVGPFSVDGIYRSLDDKTAARVKALSDKNQISAVYAYEDGALSSFKMAKLNNIQCLFDLPIGYWKSARRLLNEERLKNPEWANTLTGFKDSNDKLERKDEELKLADRIFVASSFTKKTLKEFDGKLPEIEVVPYGFPEVKELKKYESIKGRKLKVLFVGGLSQRKGISYLFDAVEGLEEHVSLTVVGQKAVSDCAALNKSLTSHTWIPSMPHHEVLECMGNHDVFVFPSLFEGFGMVITEAMSQGLPVITTDRTAGPDLIENGDNGWIVETSSSKAIREVLERILADESQLAKVGRAAQLKAKTRPWSVYGDELVQAILNDKKDL